MFPPSLKRWDPTTTQYGVATQKN